MKVVYILKMVPALPETTRNNPFEKDERSFALIVNYLLAYSRKNFNPTDMLKFIVRFRL